MEIGVLKHRAKLTPEQIAENDRRSAKPQPGSLPPLQYKTITVSKNLFFINHFSLFIERDVVRFSISAKTLKLT